MSNQNTTPKTYTLTAYEISVIMRAIISQFHEQDIERGQKLFAETAPWQGVLKSIDENRLKYLQENHDGELSTFLDEYVKAFQTSKN